MINLTPNLTNSYNQKKAKDLFNRMFFLAQNNPEDAGLVQCLYFTEITLFEKKDKDKVIRSIRAFSPNDSKDIYFRLWDYQKYESRTIIDPFDSELERRIDMFELTHV